MYTQLPPAPLPDADSEPPIWKLCKTLYGLRRSSKASYDDLSGYLVKKLITIAGLNDDDKMVYIPLRKDWSDEYQDASPLCTSTDNYRILLAHIASGAHLSDQITQAMHALTLASALPKPLLTPSITKASSVALVRNRELSA